ncbi:MAG: hypothetical protein ONB16_00455 [candidate division KSB1 bacterium]|nr:hypothetical protein [candidate division KSB1 bacterium]MDZ7317702.1 hypothetical protein [candidate division KSB1 bacterium]MDZ7342344.1 hypothetical protein [candidate division KSB1 bacterium]
MKKIATKGCPEVYLIEAFVSDNLPAAADQETILGHLQSCPRCQAIYSELRQFYDIFHQETRKPVHSSLFKIIAEVARNQIALAGILLQPLAQQSRPNSLCFRSEVVFLRQSVDDADIDDLDCIPVADDEVFLRIVQKKSTQEVTAFIYAEQEKLYRNVQLQLENHNRMFTSDSIGKVEMGPLDISALENQTITITPATI